MQKTLSVVSSCVLSAVKHLFGYQAPSVERELAFRDGWGNTPWLPRIKNQIVSYEQRSLKEIGFQERS